MNSKCMHIRPLLNQTIVVFTHVTLRYEPTSSMGNPIHVMGNPIDLIIYITYSMGFLIKEVICRTEEVLNLITLVIYITTLIVIPI